MFLKIFLPLAKSKGLFFPLLVALTALSILGGCGSETPPPLATADRPMKEARAPETTAGPNRSETGGGSKPGPTGSNRGISNREADREARLESLREQIEGGDNPATAEILYAALSDPEPEVGEEVAKWLRDLVADNPEARGKIEKLQGKEQSMDAWKRATDILAPREEPVETVPAEETGEGNG